MTLSTRFDEALLYASQLHREQLRKGTTIPYISHLLGVCSIALEYGADEDAAIAALLHDAVEDQGGEATLAVIRACFGDAVAEIVLGCTDALVVPKPPWRARKEAYLVHLRSAPATVRLVSACDKLYNARAILRDYRELGGALWERFTGGCDGTLWYYHALTDVYRLFGPDPLIDELDRTVSELEQLAGRGLI
jgi:(p)ppGpp synthase/HD superfamily hydrolase